MNIHEYQASQLFSDFLIPTGGGRVTDTVDQALSVAGELGYPVVLKAQVLVGGRGKAGGVKVVSSDDELREQYASISGLNIKGYDVERILVVKAVDIQKEFYGAVITDPLAGDAVIIASAEGGVEIEQTAVDNPDAILKFYLQGAREIDEARWPAFISQLFDDPKLQEQGTDIFKKLVKLFFESDCSLAEINPLVIDGSGDLKAIDAKVNFDDNAMYRQPDIEALRDMKYEVQEELDAKEAGLSFVKLDGKVGCIVNGAGLAMGTMDAVNLLGGTPANFLDVGGSSNPNKVIKAIEIILRDPQVNVILINIFGGITRCDDIANGILEAKNQIDIKVPLVIRLTGTNEEEAVKILADQGISCFTNMREAVLKAVELSK